MKFDISNLFIAKTAFCGSLATNGFRVSIPSEALYISQIDNTLCEMSRRMFIAFHDDRVSSKHVMMFARIASSALTIATRTLVTRLLLNPLAISGRAPQPMLSR